MSEAVAATIPELRESGAELPFERLYHESRDDVYAYVTGLLRDRGAAEEVTAAAFERAYRKRGRFDADRGSPRAWLFGIARNAALDELRRRGRQVPLGDDGLMGLRVADHAERSALRVALAGAVGRLAAAERELIALKFFAGLDNAEIGAVIGISESNVGTRLHRIVNKLREALDENA